MARVTGIGGLFFRSDDPAGLAAWYHAHLGIDPVGETGAWTQEAGPTVFAPFGRDTGYFGDPSQAFMVNLRVDDLDGMLADLASAGIEAETRADWDMPGIGRFARIHDPEGNPIELWEPAPEALAGGDAG